MTFIWLRKTFFFPVPPTGSGEWCLQSNLGYQELEIMTSQSQPQYTSIDNSLYLSYTQHRDLLPLSSFKCVCMGREKDDREQPGQNWKRGRWSAGSVYLPYLYQNNPGLEGFSIRYYYMVFSYGVSTYTPLCS